MEIVLSALLCFIMACVCAYNSYLLSERFDNSFKIHYVIDTSASLIIFCFFLFATLVQLWKF